MDASAEWLGYAAATLTTASFVPQALLSLRTRDVRGISAGMYGVFTVGVALWLAYGVALGAWPIIAANAVTLALAGTILATKLGVERSRAREQSNPAPGRGLTGKNDREIGDGPP